MLEKKNHIGLSGEINSIHKKNELYMLGQLYSKKMEIHYLILFYLLVNKHKTYIVYHSYVVSIL